MKKIMMIIVMCLMLVGCGKGYGIFTKEGYDLFTKEERDGVEEYVNSMFSIRMDLDFERYSEAMNATIHSPRTEVKSIQASSKALYKILITEKYDIDKAIKEYDYHIGVLSKYINEDAIKKIDIDDDKIKKMLEFRYAAE